MCAGYSSTAQIAFDNGVFAMLTNCRALSNDLNADCAAVDALPWDGIPIPNYVCACIWPLGSHAC